MPRRWLIPAAAAAGVSIGLAITITSWVRAGTRNRERAEATRAVIETVDRACRAYRDRHGSWPEELHPYDLEPFLPPRFALKDAWGRHLQYRRPGTRNPAGVDLWSEGPDPARPEDDLGNWR
jgi:type II secretory pathway pseudopilin PulG